MKSMELPTLTTTSSEAIAYCAVDGSRISDEVAQTAGPALAELAEDQNLDPEHVVEKAREDERLYGRFTWDDQEAANKYRLEEARHLIKSIAVKLVTHDPDEGPRKIRAFHIVEKVRGSETEPKKNTYVPLKIVRESKDMTEQVIARARWELKAFEKKYALYEDEIRGKAPDVARVMDAISDIEQEAEDE